jgi:hypothetical protein
MGKEKWYQKQLRMVQTVLREPDAVNYDAKAVVEYLKEIKANCIITHGGGDTDFFISNLELANPTPFLGEQDILADLVEEAHKNGIKVIVRVDFRGVQRERYDRYPHWFALNADGTPVYAKEFDLYVPCYNSFYVNEYAVDYIRDLMDRYDIDGIWENAIGFGVGPCYCKACRDRYKRDKNKEIPQGVDYYSREFDEYRLWKAKCADEHIELLRNTVKEYGDEKAYCAEIFGMFHAHRAKSTGIDLYNAREHFDFLVSPNFLSTHSATKGHYHQLTTPASAIRFMKSVNRDKQAVVLYGNNGGKWRYVKEPHLESRIWLWETVSVGGGLWNCMFNGQHPGATFDNRNSYLERDVYHYLADNEEILETQIPREEVGIYFSKASRDYLADDDEDKDEYGVFIKGIENVLIDNHVQYGFCPDINFSLDEVSKYKLLIVPNGAYLSDEHIEIIRKYVSMGGGLIASYETSLYDEKGNKREDFGLGDLFGCSYTGIRKDTQIDCYQMLKEPHTITSGFRDTSLLMNDGYTLQCTPTGKEGYQVVCTYVPKIPNQPPPKAWIKDMRTPFPTIIAGTYGKGRVVYFANQMDKLCYTNGHEDFMDLVYNSIMWAKSDELSIETNAPDSVHIALTENKDDNKQLVLSLTNHTSKPRRPIRQLLPVYDFYVDCRLEGDSLEDYKILRLDGDITVQEISKENGMLTVRIEIKRLDEFASIYFRVK